MDFATCLKNNGRRGIFEEPLQRCNLCGKLSTRDLFIIYVRRSGNRFPERGCILENQILRFPRAIVPDKCNTSCDLVLLFLGRRGTLERWDGEIAKRIGTRRSVLRSIGQF